MGFMPKFLNSNLDRTLSQDFLEIFTVLSFPSIAETREKLQESAKELDVYELASCCRRHLHILCSCKL